MQWPAAQQLHHKRLFRFLPGTACDEHQPQCFLRVSALCIWQERSVHSEPSLLSAFAWCLFRSLLCLLLRALLSFWEAGLSQCILFGPAPSLFAIYFMPPSGAAFSLAGAKRCKLLCFVHVFQFSSYPFSGTPFYLHGLGDAAQGVESPVHNPIPENSCFSS